jgi:hypothetical protein
MRLRRSPKSLQISTLKQRGQEPSLEAQHDRSVDGLVVGVEAAWMTQRLELSE